MPPYDSDYCVDSVAAASIAAKPIAAVAFTVAEAGEVALAVAGRPATGVVKLPGWVAKALDGPTALLELAVLVAASSGVDAFAIDRSAGRRPRQEIELAG